MKKTSALTAMLLLAALGACADTAEAPPEPEGTASTGAGAPDCPTLGSEHSDLTPGCWAIRAAGIDGVRAELEVPRDGFTGSYSWIWNNPPREDHWGAITLEAVGGVYSHPCRAGGEPGRAAGTAQEFVKDLAAQPVTRTTEPVPVTLGDFDGIYVEITTPADYDVGSCHDDELYLWQLPAEPTTLYAGHVRHMWVIDVAGQLMVLTSATAVDATPGTLELFTTIPESAIISVT